MAKHSKLVNGNCAYCGTWAKLTKDHVIPVCLFGDVLPKDIPVVWACATCNNVKKSVYDTFLRDMLICDIDNFNHSVVQAIFNGKFSRAVGRNQSRLVRHVRSRMRPVASFTPSGIFVGYNYGSPLPPGEVAEVLGTIVRGLHIHYLHRPISDDIEFTVHRIVDREKVLPIAQFARQAGILTYSAVGDSTIFNCLYGTETADPALTMWFLSFYSSPTSAGSVYRITTRSARRSGGVS